MVDKTVIYIQVSLLVDVTFVMGESARKRPIFDNETGFPVKPPTSSHPSLTASSGPKEGNG